MELIGELLRKSRISKKLDLRKVSSTLNISKNILEDIENNHFPDYIDPSHHQKS